MTPCEELGYKVGDMFRVESGIFKSQTVMLEKDDGTNIPYFKMLSSGMNQCVKLDRLTKITDYKVVKGKDMKSNVDQPDHYEINLTSKAQLHFDRVFDEEVSARNPIAVVEVTDHSGKEFFVLVHVSLVHKADICEMDWNRAFLEQRNVIECVIRPYGEIVLSTRHGKNVSLIIDFFKKVRNTKWPDSSKDNNVKVIVRKVKL